MHSRHLALALLLIAAAVCMCHAQVTPAEEALEGAQALPETGQAAKVEIRARRTGNRFEGSAQSNC